jgi:putative DNA primase/helicase
MSAQPIIHDLQHAQDVVQRNPEVPLDVLLNHPHKKWTDEAKAYFGGLMTPAAVASEPETVKIATPVPVTKVSSLPKISAIDVGDEPKTGRYSKYILYDDSNPKHREQRVLREHRRIEYDGYYFLKTRVKPEHESEIDAHWAKHDELPYGVVPRDGGIGEARFPVENSPNSEDVQWLFRARALREAADYDDAVYAEWSDLQPCAGELKPVQAFDPDWLPDAVRQFVIDISERMSVPIDFPAICAIACLAGATNHRAFSYPLAMDKDFAEPLCASGAVIADSGKKKSPTWKILMKPLNEWEIEQDDVYQQRMAEYTKDLNKFDAAKKGIDDRNKEEKKQAKKENREPNLETYESLPFRPTEPDKPRRLIVNDSTSEQIHEIAKTNPQGLFYYRDELSGWAAEMDMVGREGSRSMFLQGMTGDHDHTVDRIGREGGHAKMTLSVFGSFQPHLFVNFLSETRNVADGTIPRFHLIVWPDDSELPTVDRQVNTVAKAQYREVIRRLADLPDKSVHIHLGKEAQELFYQFQKDLKEKIRKEPNPGKKSHLSKYEGGLGKIAALLQLVDVAAALPQTPKLSTVNLGTGASETTMVLAGVPEQLHVDLAHFQRALNLLAYLESHMHRVYDSKLEGIEYRKIRLVEHLKDGSIRDGMSAREIHQKDWAGLSRKVTTADAIEAALDELAELGWVRPIPVKPGTARPGRPTKRWEVNPAARGG